MLRDPIRAPALRSRPGREEVSVRIPLQVGTSALRALIRANLGLAAAALMGVVGIALLYAFPPGGVVALLLASTLAGGATGDLWLAVRWRASDLLVAAAGIRFEGGPCSGTFVPWSEARCADWSLDTFQFFGPTLHHLLARLRGGAPDIWALEIPIPDDDDDDRVFVVNAEDEAEAASLGVTLATLQSLASPDEATPSDPRVVRCGVCGASVAPVDSAIVRCDHCGTDVAMPDAVRQRFASERSRASDRARDDAVLARLLAQPGAARVNSIFLATSITMLAAWPLGTAVAIRFVWARVFDHDAAVGWSMVGSVAVMPFAITVGGACLLAPWILRRRALQLVTLHFAARAGAPGEPLACCTCGGPLPATGGSAIVGCAYCETPNIIALAVRRPLAASSGITLDAAVGRARDTSRRSALAGLVGAAALVLCGGATYASISRWHGSRAAACAASAFAFEAHEERLAPTSESTRRAAIARIREVDERWRRTRPTIGDPTVAEVVERYVEALRWRASTFEELLPGPRDALRLPGLARSDAGVVDLQIEARAWKSYCGGP